jgi:ATP-binding cassette subfamily B protein
LRNVLMLVVALYLGAFLLSWLQGYILNGVVQSTVYDLRSDVEDKLNRLPLRYFDGAPRGELLSRVTNDIDNISSSLQQTLSQLLTSLLTVIGVVTMMFVVSPTLALIALVTIPISMVLTAAIARRSQKRFVAQWMHTGR